jgi:hypothetical protein
MEIVTPRPAAPQPGPSAILIICDREHLPHLAQAVQQLGGGGWFQGAAEFQQRTNVTHVVLCAPDKGRIERREPLVYLGTGAEGLLLAITAACRQIHGAAKILRLIDDEARRIVDPVILAATVPTGRA